MIDEVTNIDANIVTTDIYMQYLGYFCIIYRCIMLINVNTNYYYSINPVYVEITQFLGNWKYIKL
jgi:hypothetical protein